MLSQEKGKAALRNEIDILSEIRHDNLMALYGIYESSKTVYIVLEYHKGETLIEFLEKQKSFGESDLRRILKPILDALSYLHKLKIMHRDVKPENIIVSHDNGRVVASQVLLNDMSLATKAYEPYVFFKCGTPGFIAPEIFSATSRYDPVCDIFSLGVCFYIMYLPLLDRSKAIG